MMTQLPAADWLVAPGTRSVMRALDASGLGESRFVGGCVRNTLMGRPVDDIDIATQLLPEQTLAALEVAGIRAIPTGIEHGTVTAVVNGEPYEITSLRRDVETDGRRAVVAFTRDWAEDAERRDFRLNAIYADVDGTLHDPTQGGVRDAETGRVIFIGDADQRLREDYLRILRFFRFNAWYGAEIDADGLAACARQKRGLEKIAAERIWKELKKLLTAPDPTSALDAMATSGVTGMILPEADNAGSVASLVAFEKANQVAADPMRRLMKLVRFQGGIAERFAKRLRLSNREAERLIDLEKVRLSMPRLSTSQETRQAFYEFGPQAVLDYALDEAGDTALGGTADGFISLRQLADDWGEPAMPVAGADLLKAGLKPGPSVGVFLKMLEKEWIESDFKLTRSALMDMLEAELKAD